VVGHFLNSSTLGCIESPFLISRTDWFRNQTADYPITLDKFRLLQSTRLALTRIASCAAQKAPAAEAWSRKDIKFTL
jgi:hypothetical protein